ncbi:MAG: ATP-binding protein [Candidatus Sumerlaeota bacterium]|nr:ATP-binding protein [Candidatus Sumerlaeota bacterium]
MENTLKTPDTMTKPLRPTTKQAAWEEFLETMLVYASGRVQDGPLAEIIANGLNAFSYLPGYRSATLYFMDKDTYEFRHSTSIPESAQNWAQQLFSRLVDQGDIAWALDSGHAFVSPKQDDPQRPAHLMILTLSVPTTVIGLMLIFLDEPPELMEHMIRGLCLLHAKTFAYMLNNVTMIGELRGQQSILEQRVAARTQSLEQAKRALEITTQRIKEAKEVAERASEFKSAFLANMSHEIRTPLNGVLGMLALTLESDLNPMQRDFLQTAQKSAQSLLALINNILDLAKIEAGRFEKHDVKFNLCDLLSTVADTTAHGAHQKGIELICAADEDVPVLLVGDDGWLRQILVNLAGNAIKFTEKGEVILRIERLNTDQTRARVRFSVTDSGIGISKKNQARVFESFTQADGSVTRKYGGTGLGLTISRQLCQRMGGQMQLESEEGKGSRFWFDVELDQQTGLPPALPRLPEGHRILIIDDNQAAAQTLARILQAWGGAAQIASEAGEGIRIAGQAEAQGAPFHSIFCDLTLAGPGALPEAAAPLLPNLLREATAASGARIIGMAQPGRPHYDWGALDKLCDLMLNKPLKRDHLLIALGLAPMEGAAKILAETRAPETVRAGARILLVEDVEINRKVVRGMLKDSGCQIETAENGREAISALEKKTFDLVRRKCGDAKGTGARRRRGAWRRSGKPFAGRRRTGGGRQGGAGTRRQ